jgi:hypothetical protein
MNEIERALCRMEGTKVSCLNCNSSHLCSVEWERGL